MVRRAALVLLLMSTQASAEDEGLKAWGKIYQVLSHPRCSNCHVGGSGTPIWSGSDFGKEPGPHGMHISGGGEGDGAEFIPCGACHGKRNSPMLHGPPGAAGPPEWHLAPASMQWSGKSSAEICAQVKDPGLNGGRRSVHDLTDHFESGLVRWGWAPGPGRDHAPYSVGELITFFSEWDAAGRPCPAK
jgi:hypothetical protein